MAPNASDRERQQHEHDRPGRPGRDAVAEGDPDGKERHGLDQPEREDAGELAQHQRDPRSSSERKPFRKPLSMSLATFVPALFAEKSAPWMNGIASANWKYESVGKPGRCVACRGRCC